jgi:hypothetical protein
MIFKLTIIAILIPLNFLCTSFLKSLKEDPNYSGLAINKIVAISKFSPLGAIIALFLVSFGLLLITIETINKLIKN